MASEFEKIVRDWPDQSSEACKRLVDKYGPPDEVSNTRMIWHGNGPWKRTVLSRDPVPHQWPMEHADMVESVIDYHVPPEKASDLARFDGSVIIERTKGELSARCEAEEANFLALNLAHELIEGKRDLEEAREEYARNMQKKQTQGMGPYMNGFMFDLPQGPTQDPDRATLDGKGNRIRDEHDALEQPSR